MRYIDFHCDTIYEALIGGCDISNPSFHITPEKTRIINPYIQCFAICVPEEIVKDDATLMFKQAYKKLVEQCAKYDIKIIKSYKDIEYLYKNGGKGAVFTVENASVLAGKLENIKLFSDYGVKIVTLTWNGENELGGGAQTNEKLGLTDFGTEVIRELENKKIIIDVSHASDKLFYDVVSNSKRPLIATHSNSRSVTDVKRNLTDEQFEIIKSRGGVVGLNFHRYFLNNNPQKASMYDILRHCEYFLSLGGENTVAIGADFDGCELPDDIKGIDSLGDIYEMFLSHNYSESLVDKIFFENAREFCKNFDK